MLALCSSLAAQFDPPNATDINPDPAIVEVVLTASVTTWQYVPGVDTAVWAYNGSVPGPNIRAEVGDTLVVHFTNNLPEPTTIHWHGIENYADMDGAHVSQRPIEPGETFDYAFPLLRDGLYWYHPHVRTNDQVEKGLYGTLLVTDPTKEPVVFANLGGRSVEEHIVVFDDILLDDDMQVVPAFESTDPLENAIYTLNGRIGNHLLVNGREASTVTLDVTNGAVQRWWVVNAANSTFCRLDLNDASTGLGTMLWEIGSDGGFNDRPFRRYPVTSTAPFADHPGQALLSEMGQGILCMPGERLQVVFTPNGPDGTVATVQQKDWFRGRHIAQWSAGPGSQIMLLDDPLDGAYPDQPYFKIRMNGPPATTEPWRPVFALNLPRAPSAPIGNLPFTFGHANPDPTTGDVMMFAQADMSSGSVVGIPRDKVTSREAHDVNVGEVWRFEVLNLTHGDHPFHAHGFFFELEEYEFQDDTDPSLNFFFRPFARRQIKDTIRLPARLGAKGTSRTFARLRVWFDDTGRQGRVAAMGENATYAADGSWMPGGWLVHCHVLEHSAKGMLTFFEVHDPSNPFTLLGRHLGGAAGLPSLTARGDLSPGSVVDFDLVDAAPNAPTILLLSDTAGYLPILGGTLVPTGQLAFLTGGSDAMGRTSWPLAAWSVLPSGTPLYVQAGIADAAAPQGVSLSNALTFDVP